MRSRYRIYNRNTCDIRYTTNVGTPNLGDYLSTAHLTNLPPYIGLTSLGEFYLGKAQQVAPGVSVGILHTHVRRIDI